MPNISLGTVYRNLDMLCQSGMIQRLDISGGPMRFDGNTAKHYHVRCVRCGLIQDIPMEPLTEIEMSVYKMCGFEVTGHAIEFTGVCPSCREKEADRYYKDSRG